MIKPVFKYTKQVDHMDRLNKLVQSLQEYQVNNGILAGIGAHPNSKQGLTVATIAAYNEFGTPNAAHPIPSRPFMRNAYEKFKRYGFVFFERAFKVCFCDAKKERLKATPRTKDFFTLIGLKIQSFMVSHIDENMAPPNAPATIAKKGSAHTLFDTGILKKSISFEVFK